jgi:uncharacterized YceG family protein
VSGFRERSAEEREAARREREAARREREARRPASAGPVSDPDAEPVEADDDGFHTDELELEARPQPGDPDYEPPAGVKRVFSTRSGEGSPRPAVAPRGGRRHGHTWPGRVLALLAFAALAAGVWFMVELWQPFHASPGNPIVVTIPPRLASSAVGDLLERDGVISSSFFFEARATLAGERGHLHPGTYRLRRNMTYGAVLAVLTKPPPPIPVTEVTITEGKSRRQIAELLRAQGIRGDYLAATMHSPLLDRRLYGAPRGTPTLEGFLFPSTYELRAPVSVQQLVAKQLTEFKRQFASVDLRYAHSRHLSAYDVLIIASIIEKEAATAHDRPLVASVIYNRLKDHMPLGMDSTTRYEFNDYAKPLTAAQLAAPSPYNTRLHAGLPPTPIGNPGLAAIQAAAHPANTSYLYFVVKPCGNGASVFSSNYRQFLADSARYQTARARRGGRSPVSC